MRRRWIGHNITHPGLRKTTSSNEKYDHAEGNVDLRPFHVASFKPISVLSYLRRKLRVLHGFQDGEFFVLVQWTRPLPFVLVDITIQFVRMPGALVLKRKGKYCRERGGWQGRGTNERIHHALTAFIGLVSERPLFHAPGNKTACDPINSGLTRWRMAV